MGHVFRHAGQVVVLYLKGIVAIFRQTVAVFRQELVVVQLRLNVLMRWIRGPLAGEMHHFTDEKVSLRAVGAVKEGAYQTGRALVHLTGAALLIRAQAVLRTQQTSCEITLVFRAGNGDFHVVFGRNCHLGVLRNVQQDRTLVEHVTAGNGLRLAVPLEGHAAAHQVVNDLLRVVEVHHVARCHLDNTELHAHHFRVLDCGDHAVVALIEGGLVRIFHNSCSSFLCSIPYYISEAARPKTGGSY